MFPVRCLKLIAGFIIYYKLSANSRLARITTSILPWLTLIIPSFAQAGQITPAQDGTGTVITTQGNKINISGGSLSGDGTNLFQSFAKFGLTANQTANFLSSPSIQNILGIVKGGNASVINGLITITGGNSNLYLVNPSGIIFGPKASLNLPAAFTATTANRIGFGDYWLSTNSSNNYTSLTGTPSSFAFDTNIGGAIVNQGNLVVTAGNNLTLLAGTVASTGELTAPGGNVTVSTVPGTSLLRFTIPGDPLSLEIQPLNSSVSSNNSSTNSLATILTGGHGGNATQLIVNQNGEVELTGSGLLVQNGDLVVNKITAGSATLAANHDLILPASQISTTGNLNLLANNTVQALDNIKTALTVKSGGNLDIFGNQGIDILALNHVDQTSFISGGNLTLVSNGKISLDSHFQSGGNFSILNSQGGAGNFISLYDPIISSNSDVTFGDYTGPSLEVESKGSITGGDITITGADTTLCPNGCTPGSDTYILSTEPSVILRAGLSQLANSANIPITTSGTSFTTSGATSSAANITVGNISTNDNGDSSSSGRVILQSLTGNVQTNNIDTSLTETDSASSGSVDIQAFGSINTGSINTSLNTYSSSPVVGGGITLNAGSSIITGDLSTSSSGYVSSTSGSVSLTAVSDITTGIIDTSSGSTTSNATGGAVSLITTQAAGSKINFNSIDTSASAPGVASGGNVTISSMGVIQGTGFVPGDDNPYTILTTGTTSSGSVEIQHDGGPNNVPFIVGDASLNGTAGSITSGDSTITPTTPFPVLPTGGPAPGTPNNITITSINTPPTLTGNTQLPSTQENKSITFTFGSLNTSVNDVNQDNTTVVIDAIQSGTLTLQNGTPVTNNTQLSSGTVLVYTPPTNVTGKIAAFTIQASDGVSYSSPQAIAINVTSPITPTVIPSNSPNPEILQKVPNHLSLPTSLAIPSQTDVTRIEQKFTNQYQQYLNLPITQQIKTDDQVQDILESIEHETGIKPAIIYVDFLPSSVSTSSSPTQYTSITSRDDRLELVVVTAHHQPIRKVINVKRSEVIAMAQTFKSRITSPTLQNNYLNAAKTLYNWIIAPIDSELQALKIQNLVFITDTGLRSLPIAALYDGKNYLVERYSVGLMPSLSLTDTKYVDIKKAEVLAMGASKFKIQQPLLAVPTELDTVTGIWKGESFLNQGFTFDNLRGQRQQKPYSIIHLATHAQFKPGRPGESYIQLWDGQLKMDQLRELGWNNPPVELVVLSACRTALGDEEAELGFSGFAVQAGSKSALASLWYVSDEGTLGLMSEFYQRLKTAPIKSEALREVQIAMIKGEVRLSGGKLITSQRKIDLPPILQQLGDRELQHPYFWAAFTMIGNPW